MWSSIPALDAKERIVLRIAKRIDASNHSGKSICVPNVCQTLCCQCQSGNSPRPFPWTALNEWPLSMSKPCVCPKVVYAAAVLAELCVSECCKVGSYAGYSRIQTELVSGFTLDQQRAAHEILLKQSSPKTCRRANRCVAVSCIILWHRRYLGSCRYGVHVPGAMRHVRLMARQVSRHAFLHRQKRSEAYRYCLLSICDRNWAL